MSKEVAASDEEGIQTKEQAILDLGALLSLTKKAQSKNNNYSDFKNQAFKLYLIDTNAKELAELIVYTRPFLNMVSKAKAAKLVRNLVDMFLDLEAGTGEEIRLCAENIEWAKNENRTFLRQALEVFFSAIFFQILNTLHNFKRLNRF